MKFTKLKVALLLLLWLALPVASLATDIEDAIHAMREGNFAEAYCILRPYADAGDAEAQYNIGWMYLNGYGLAINDNLALEWWRRASDQGHTDASFSLAMLYSLGDGQVKKDMNKAIDYYLLAAEDEHEDARMIIKSMLLRNDKDIRDRAQQIINTYPWVGTLYQVKAKRLNVRSAPSTEAAIVRVLEQGEVVTEIDRKNNWSLVAIKDVDKTAWVYNPLLEIASPEVLGLGDDKAITEDEVAGAVNESVTDAETQSVNESPPAVSDQEE